MAEKRGLGRGLDALLGDYSITPPAGVQTVDIYLLDTNMDQPRKTFDADRLEELAGSIKRHGMVQPIIVRTNGARYTIVAGERRYRAARLAGLSTVPIVVKEMDDSEVMEVALIENIQREDLNPIEEAAAIKFLMQQHDLTQEDVANRLFKSRPAIANALRLLSLPEGVQDLLRERKLQAGHARALAGLHDTVQQEKLAQEIAEKGLSVRDVETKVKNAGKGRQLKVKSLPSPADSDFLAAEEKMRNILGTKVSIVGSKSKGKIVIEYYSEEGLQNIYAAVTGE